MQALVHRTAKLPEADHAGELDDLRCSEVLFHALPDLVRHRRRILRCGANVIEADTLHLACGHLVADDDILQFLLAHSPAFDAVYHRLLEHGAAVRCRVGAAVDGAGDRGELALEKPVKRRGGVAHDVAFEPPQRLGDLRPPGIELVGVGQKANLAAAVLDHGLQPVIEVRLAHVRDEGLGLEQDLGLGWTDGIHHDPPSQGSPGS